MNHQSRKGQMTVYAIQIVEDDTNDTKYGPLFSEPGDESYVQDTFESSSPIEKRPPTECTQLLPSSSAPSPCLDELAVALRNGDHAVIRRSLVAKGKSTYNIDSRFITSLRDLANGSQKLEHIRRLRKGLAHIINEWNHISSSTRSQIRAVNAHVAALEAFKSALISETLCEIRRRVNYIIDQVEFCLVQGTHLGTLLQFLLRSLRDPVRREASKARYRKIIVELGLKVKTLMENLELSPPTSP